MGNKVKISEFIEFKNDFSDASANLKSQLKEIEKNIETLRAMDSFAGEAAKGAKEYFNDVHQTILKSFEHLFTDLEERMEKHETTFSSRVDSSETAIIYSDYLLSTEKDMDKDYESFIEEKENIRKTLADVSDISSADNPHSFTFDRSYTDAADMIIDTEEDLESYGSTDIDNAAEIEELFHNLETTIKDSGAVSGNEEFTYLEGTCPTSLQALEGHNLGKHKDMMEEATESRDSAVKNMDPSSEEIASKALKDLENGVIEEDEYYAYIGELRKLNNETDPDENVSQSFITYLSGGETAKSVADNVVTGTIREMIDANGNDKIIRGDLIKDMNAGKPGAGAYLRREGNRVLNIGTAFTGAISALTVVSGTYDDYKNNDKEWGEAAAKNSADGFVSATAAGYAGTAALSIATTAGAATPIGWAVVGGAVVGVAATKIFNVAYDNNFLKLQDGLDWVGNKSEKVGDAITGFFKNTVFG